MADMIDFSQLGQGPDLYDMTPGELSAYLEDVRTQISQLDEQEPEDMESEAYEAWGDLHEELEDLADEIQDLLDEAGGPTPL